MSFLYGPFGILLFGGTLLASQSSLQVQARGQTILRASLGGSRVEVRLHARVVEIGPPSGGRPMDVYSNCTYSRYPCSVLDGLTILVGEARIAVPRSAFGDLADVNAASVSEDGHGMLLTLRAGDASESTIVKIWFNSKMVVRRSVFSAMDDSEALEDTVYHSTAPLE